jgi:hypothetical protein
MPWRPVSPRDSIEGVGYATADEVRMPLSPTAMLVMQRRHSVVSSPRRVALRRFHEYNEDIPRQCYEFVVCTPGRRARLDAVEMSPNRPAVRFNTEPGFRTEADGSETPMGDVVHKWTPMRA